MLLDRLAHVGVLVGGAGEEFHRREVGVRVDDAPHHLRARLGADPRQVAHPRHEAAQEGEVAGDPQRHRQRQPRVGGDEDQERRRAVDNDVPDGADAGDDALAQRVRGVHHPVGDAAGEVVLEERPRLPDHVPVALPADQRRHRGNHRVVAHHRVEREQQRPAEQHHGGDRHQQRPLLAERRDAILGRHQAHQLADEHGDQQVDQRHRQPGDEHRREQPRDWRTKWT